MFTKETAIIIIFFTILGALLLGAAALPGWIIKLAFKLQHNYGLYVGLALAALSILFALWGSIVGFSRFKTQRVTLACEGLPKEFDDYRIIHITDAHAGSFSGREKLWTKAVDAILKENADLIVFTGDMQNRTPGEIEPFMQDMARLKARDGVVAVLGNHDYGYPPAASSPRRVREAEENAGWRVLVNEYIAIVRDSARIIIGGMDNDGDGEHFPRRGDVMRTLTTSADSTLHSPVADDDFIIILEHDPTSWRRNILPNSHAQLTLSGHTHAMQFGLFGWSPSKWIYPEWRGLFSENGRHLYVSSGVGGVIPFRFGMPREMVIIELQAKQ